MDKLSIFEPTGYRLVAKTLTFAGATPNAVGDFGGTGDPANVFTVTGDVIVNIIAVCTTDLASAGGGSVELGIGGGAEIIPATLATAIDAREIWWDISPDAEIEPLSTIRDFIVTDGNDIQLDVTTADIESGVIVFYCFWTPLSSDGAVSAA